MMNVSPIRQLDTQPRMEFEVMDDLSVWARVGSSPWERLHEEDGPSKLMNMLSEFDQMISKK